MATTAIGGVLATVALAQDDATPTVLTEIVVEGASYETEGSESYTTDLVSVGEKDVRSVREIPQSTTVLTRERLEDAGYTSLDTAMRETPGIVVLNNDDGRSSIFSRGFEFDNLYYNGLPAPVSSIYGTQPDMSIIDHVEILRGPAGLFGGTGEPAGAINMRLKQAQDQFGASLSGEYGAWEHARGEMDVTGPLNRSGTIRGRFVGTLQNADGWVDEVENDVGVAYGTLQADLTPDTTATLSISHLERDITPFNGLPTYEDGSLIDLDRSTFTGASWNGFDNSVTDYIAELEHRFDDGGHAKISGRYQATDVDFLYSYAAGYAAPNGDIISRGADTNDSAWLARDYEADALSLDAHVSKPFYVGGLEQNVLLGVDYQNQEMTTLQGRGSIAVSQNIYDWTTDISRPDVDYTSQVETDPEQFGVYGQLRVKPFDQLTLIGGGRFTWYEATSRDLLTGTETDSVSENGYFVPYAGVVFDLTDWVSAYASYTSIFQPQADTDASGAVLDPREGEQYEVGFKAELFDSGMNASIAYFNLSDTNRAVADIDNPGFNIAQGEVEVQGLEIEATGSPLMGLEVAAGYTFTDTEFAQVSGERFQIYTPEHMFHLWATYDFDERHGWLDGFSIGGGVKAFSSVTVEQSGYSIDAPGYTVVDLTAGYEFNEHVEATLIVNNLFDEKYYSRVGSNSVFNFYGEPLNAKFKLTASF
ncbi:TonB-dependent siderophore receptor [Notoacmeibacter ruber]|uniref:TonB-dependent siderophore receptor n=1 Tax=Notoacmeibacter ruber TaxID=2670375 RepID=UPI0018F5DC96|nr:TonB-dependent siderophore receptor [Notoacmeibacter ruber]